MQIARHDSELAVTRAYDLLRGCTSDSALAAPGGALSHVEPEEESYAALATAWRHTQRADVCTPGGVTLLPRPLVRLVQ